MSTQLVSLLLCQESAAKNLILPNQLLALFLSQENRKQIEAQVSN